MFDVTGSQIEATLPRIRSHVRRTPAWLSPALSERFGRRVHVKLECLQVGGSFKARGVAAKLLSMSEQERRNGVVAVSGGNHAIAVARGAAAFGVDALIMMPRVTPAFNVDETRRHGATVELADSAAEAFAKAEALAGAGRTNLHAYDDPVIIAGNGTVGLEFVEDVPALSHVFVSIGGGGFSTGVAAAIRDRNPSARVIGVETEGAETMTQALAAGQPVTIKPTSIARTLGAPFVTQRTLEGARQHLDRVMVVTDREAVADLVWLLQTEKVLCEPAASCTVSALARHVDQLPADAEVGVILCGSNIALADLEALRTSFGL
ncbi:threonine ammonia-lyase [Alsobacter sp. R-9]